MREILSVVTYLFVWFVCQRVLDIQSGLNKLIISLGAAILVYIVVALRERSQNNKEE